ncbi:polysaccharide biosynthesis/export family protein [Novosphingobium sp.]|uniref:polysaccharide biosynthesis/export family protein n=1 Tax=Novosphingobium sp. TaxID=1874826 RepID=UPI0035B39185
MKTPLATRTVLLTASIFLAGCAAIPASGPTGAQVRSQIRSDNGNMGITLVAVRSAADLPVIEKPAPTFGQDYVPPRPTELVGVGDVLDITVYESGIALFGRAAGLPTGEMDTSSKGERLPAARVSDSGTINMPFVGELAVAGLTTDQVERLIVRSLRGKSQNPQVIVSIREGLTNSVIVGGDVIRPGRLVLPTNRETLSDVIALAGGSRGEIKDMVIKIRRGDSNGEFRLSEVLDNRDQDIRIFPADRISVVKMPRSFSVLGAAGRTEQVGFPSSSLSLVEAIALSGGANPNTGDPRAIFVFRQTKGPDGQDIPVVYHFNMMQAQSYLLAQRFDVRDKDVLYVGNASANQPTKLVQIVSQLFLPLLTLDSIANF